MADNEAVLNEWLTSLNLSEDEKKVFDAVMKDEKRGKALKDSVLMRSDYSKRMNELQSKEQELIQKIQQKESELTSHEQNLVNWKGTADQTLAKIQKERDEAMAKLASVQAKAKTLSENYGIDPKEIVGDESVRTAEPPRGDDGRFVKVDDFQKAVNDVMQFPNVAAEVYDIGAEHYELFGKPFKEARKVVSEALKNKRTLRDEWEAEYKVSERREQLAAQAKEAEEKRIRDDERNKVLSEVHIPIPRPAAANSPLFQAQLPKPTDRPTDAQSQDRIVQAAMQAYNDGRYRESKGQ